MELMIVLVIIGILSAVGMVMFGGQAEKAKIAATKLNYKNVVSYVSMVIMECQFDSNGEFDLGKGLKEKCSKIFTPDATQVFVRWTQRNDMINHYNGYGCCGHASNRDPYLGETYIAAYGTNIIKIKTNAKQGDSIMVSTLTLK